MGNTNSPKNLGQVMIHGSKSGWDGSWLSILTYPNPNHPWQPIASYGPIGWGDVIEGGQWSKHAASEA